MTYVNVSHKELDRIGTLESAIGRDIDVVVMLHDLMPIVRPHEFPAPLRRRFAAGLDETRRHARLVVTNSRTTTAEVDAFWRAHAPGERRPPVVTLGLSHERAEPAPALIAAHRAPHFVHLGAIEARKNVSLLLDVWERMCATRRDVPHLELVGEPRTPELVARARSLAPHVSIRSGASDAEVRAMLRTARALLVPSLAEGFGLPVVEALAMSTPVVCSDLPSLREASQGVAEYVAPSDVEAWARAVGEYAARDGRARRAQLRRIARFEAVGWARHFATLERVIAEARRGTLRDVSRPSSLPPPRVELLSRAS